jgi:hypothetical protein
MFPFLSFPFRLGLSQIDRGVFVSGNRLSFPVKDLREGADGRGVLLAQMGRA